MIDTDKYEGHTEGPWYASEEEMEEGKAWVMWGGEHWVVMDKSDGHLWIEWMKEDAILAADAPLLLAEVKRLQKELHIEQQIVQAFYEYRDDCCFDHCEAWMLEKGHRVMVNELSEWVWGEEK
jgi:hypothetical protein